MWVDMASEVMCHDVGSELTCVVQLYPVQHPPLSVEENRREFERLREERRRRRKEQQHNNKPAT